MDGERGRTVTKQELLKLMRLLSALESALMYDRGDSTRMPDYLMDDINSAVEVIEREILK